MDLGQILTNLGFDWRMALANLVNFLLILWLLKKFAYKPLKETINKRQQTINEGLDNAERANTELKMAKQNRDQTILDANKEANQIIARAQSEAERIVQKAKAEAIATNEEIIKEARRSMQTEKQNMLKELRNQISELVIATARKVLSSQQDGKNLAKEVERKIS